MEVEKKFLQKAKNIFKNSKTDPNSVLFSEEKIDNRLVKKLKKSKYATVSFLLKLIGLVEQTQMMKKKFQQEQIMLKKEKLKGQPFIVLMEPFTSFMQVYEIQNFLGKVQLHQDTCCWLLTSIFQKFTLILCVQEGKYYKK